MKPEVPPWFLPPKPQHLFLCHQDAIKPRASSQMSPSLCSPSILLQGDLRDGWEPCRHRHVGSGNEKAPTAPHSGWECL